MATVPFRKDYNISEFKCRVIGGGRFGRILKAKEISSDRVFAIKVVNKKKTEELGLSHQLHHELFIHSKLKHENIVQMFTHFCDVKNLYFVLEYAPKGTLLNVMNRFKYRRLPEIRAGKYIYQIASALKYIHGKKYVYGDLKPENTLIDANYNIKLADFGFSWPIYALDTRMIGGTLEFFSPELVKCLRYDEKIDLWSFGILIYEMLVGSNPFASKNDNIVRLKICQGIREIPNYVSLGAAKLIVGLTKLKPNKRIPLDVVISHYRSQMRDN